MFTVQIFHDLFNSICYINLFLHKQNRHLYFMFFSLLSLFRKKKFWEDLITYFSLIRNGPQRKRSGQQFFYCCVCNRCRVNMFTEPLPSNDGRITCRQTHRCEGFMKYAVERGTDAMIYIRSFMKICSDIWKLIRGYTDTHADSIMIS
jgi:hypothetical protein